MLAEDEVRERARYCYLVFLQLSWLSSNDSVEPQNYLDFLDKSSLGLGQDEFIVSTIEESLRMQSEDGGLQSLIRLYEGITVAFCEVLQIGMNDIDRDISTENRIKLASEMGIDLKL